MRSSSRAMSMSGFFPVTSHFLGDAPDDLGARVVVLVNPMAEAEQTKLAALHALEVGRDVVFRADLPEQLQHFLVGAAVERSVQGGGRRRHRRVGVGV